MTPLSPPPPFCCACGDFSWLLAALENLQSLVFEVRHDLADLMFRTKLRDRREEWMEALISALLNHSLAPSTAATTMAPATSDIGRGVTRLRIQNEFLFSGSYFRIMLMAMFFLIFVIALHGTKAYRQHRVHSKLLVGYCKYSNSRNWLILIIWLYWFPIWAVQTIDSIYRMTKMYFLDLRGNL
jgi:hypothetical protein